MADSQQLDRARQQQAQQRVLMAAMVASLTQAFPLLSPADPIAIERWIAAVGALVQQYGLASAELAARFYEQERDLAHAGGRRPQAAVLADTAAEAQIRATLEWALDFYDTGAHPDVDDPDATVLSLSSGAATKLAMGAGWDTLIQNFEADQRLIGWERIARPTCCYFCAMLASRGPVYRNSDTAGQRSDARFHADNGSTSEFKVHDNCFCTAVPVYGPAHEMTADARKWDALWKTSTAGKSGDAARLAFRQAFEGRTPHAS